MSKVADLRKSSDVIGRAFQFAKSAHKGQKRKSGEPYFNHVLETAEALADWNMDESTIAAGLLHDVVEDTKFTLKEIEKEFDKEVASLVDGMTKLGSVKYRGDESQIANLSKLILSTASDIRVILIKLADRRHNMRTLDALPPKKRVRIANETLEIYAPIAYRLGMQDLSGELQDLSFPYVHPKEYQWLNENIKDKYKKRETYLKKLKPKIEKAIKEKNLTYIWMDFRTKRYASLYQKLLKYDMDIDKIHDLVAFRIIVKDIEDCYAILGLIHSLWKPLPGRIKDYIANPKPNGYQSLHTTVIGPDEKVVEFQIRTEQMHNQAEYGVAAHWAYKKSGSGKSAHAKEIEWTKKMREWQSGYTDSREIVDAFKVDFLGDQILVFTPHGEIIDLPVDATPVDFAYRIHTEVGNTCVGAKVNGNIASLDSKLRSNDVIEILTQKNKKPSESWLEFVVTAGARSHIKHALRKKTSRTLKTPKNEKIELKVTAKDRVGLIKDISTVISRSHVNILSVQSAIQKKGNYHTIRVLCDTADTKKILKIILKLKELKGVKEIDHRFA